MVYRYTNKSLSYQIINISFHKLQMVVDTETHSQTLCREREFKLQVPIKSFTSELRESQERGGRKIFIARWEGGQEQNTAL